MTTTFTNLVRNLAPIILRKLRKEEARAFASAEYWEDRYGNGGTSGAGSFDRLARFKADFLNKFVAENGIHSVVEFGSGDGSQLELARYPEYVGIDVSSTAIEICRRKFEHDEAKRFYLSSDKPADLRADLSISLDVIYHLIEDDVFEQYLKDLFLCARRFVIIYSSNANQWTGVAHVRHRNFTEWVRQVFPNWELQSFINNPFPYDPAQPRSTSPSDFYVFARSSLPLNKASNVFDPVNNSSEKRAYHEFEGQTEEHPLVFDGTFKSIEERFLHLMHVRAYTEALGKIAGRTVLDLGCNNGYGTSLIAQAAHHVIGLDISLNAIEDAKLRFSAPNLHFLTYGGAQLPFADHSFDSVLSFQVIEHIKNTELYLSEIKRVLRPNGFVMITTPNASIRLDSGTKPWNPFHVTEFKAKELKGLMARFFPQVEVTGLFARRELYRIEFERCRAARGSARERIFEKRKQHEPGALRAVDYWRLFEWRMSQRLRVLLRSAGFSNSLATSVEESFYEVGGLYYSSKTLDRALDLLAIAYRHA